MIDCIFGATEKPYQNLFTNVIQFKWSHIVWPSNIYGTHNEKIYYFITKVFFLVRCRHYLFHLFYLSIGLNFFLSLLFLFYRLISWRYDIVKWGNRMNVDSKYIWLSGKSSFRHVSDMNSIYSVFIETIEWGL